MAKTHEFKGILFTDIPKEVVEKLGIKPGDEVNFIISGEQVVFEKKEKNKNRLTEAEKKLLKELMKIRHVDRKTSDLQKLIVENKEQLDSLFNKGVLFKYSRDGEEFIGIDRSYYSGFSKQAGSKGLLGNLEEKGYLILEDKKLIYKLSREIEEQKKQVKGVMGFDKKLYVVDEKVYSEAKNKIEKEMKEALTIEEASERTGLEKGLVKAVVEVLKEQGDLIEKTKGVYQLA